MRADNTAIQELRERNICPVPNDIILREANDRAFLAGVWKVAEMCAGRLAIGLF